MRIEILEEAERELDDAIAYYLIPAHLDAEKVHFSPVGLAFCVLTRF